MPLHSAPASFNTRGTLLIFWDYDTQWGADRSRSAGGIKNWGRLDFENTEELLDIHARFEIPACFAAVGAAALAGDRPYHDPAQLRRVHAAGHEIGSHAFRHEWIPGLPHRALMDILRRSKNALEQCLSDHVLTFVPPYNQPFDYAARFSFSLSERREAGKHRTDLPGLCRSLREAGFGFCRVAYRSLLLRAFERLVRRRLDRPCRLHSIEGVACARINTPCGFDPTSQAVLKKCSERGGLVVAYGHPHSLHSGNSQDARHLIAFLAAAASLRRAGRLRICRPKDIIDEAHAG